MWRYLTRRHKRRRPRRARPSVISAMSRSSKSDPRAVTCCDPGVQRAAFGGRSLDRRSAQRRDPVEAGLLDVGVDARLGDRAAIADEHDALEAKARAELADLVGQRARIAEIALEHLDGDGTAFRRAQEAEHDLRPVFSDDRG